MITGVLLLLQVGLESEVDELLAIGTSAVAVAVLVVIERARSVEPERIVPREACRVE